MTIPVEQSFSLKTLGFQQVLEFLAERAVTPMGRRFARRLLPSPDPPEVGKRLVLLRECLSLDRENLLPSLPQLPDPEPVLTCLAVPAAVLEADELADLSALSAAVAELSTTLCRLGEKAPALVALAANLPDLDGFLRQARRMLSPQGGLKDEASAALARLRHRLVVLTQKIQEKLSLHLEDPDARNYLQDEFITRRNDRFVIPVRSDSRVAVQGIVHGASASGATVFMEPLETVALNNDLVKLKVQEAAEIRRLLESLTSVARAEIAGFSDAACLMGQIDLHVAAARMARDLDLRPAEISSDGRLDLQGARHLILQQRLAEEGGRVIPCQLNLTPEEGVLVISGPNTGGKTVVLKTVGLAALMHQSGLPLPVLTGRLPVFCQVLADIGDHQSIALNLSTFSSHLQALARMTSQVQAPALVLLDELGTGTDPEEGAALGMAVVDHFRTRQALVVLTTHHNGLKAYAGTTEGVRNASVEFDEESLEPTYRLVVGVAGRSGGLEIAARLGLDPQIVNRARGLVPEKGRLVEGYIGRLATELAQLQADREAARGVLQEIGQQRRLAERERHEAEQERRRQFERLKVEIKRQFKEDLARSLERLKEVVPRKKLRHGAQLAEIEFARLIRGHGLELAPDALDETHARGAGLKVGDPVSLKGLATSGTVERIGEDGQVTLSMRGKRLVVSREDVRRVSPPAPGKGDRVVVVQRPSGETSPEVRLVGLRVDEALQRLDKYLDQALLAALPLVRVVHGRGSGRLRHAVGSWLDRHPCVQEHRPGDLSEGGSGVTVVSLKV